MPVTLTHMLSVCFPLGLLSGVLLGVLGRLDKPYLAVILAWLAGLATEFLMFLFFILFLSK